jgi:transcription antitermination factor NusA-like protein
MATYKVGYNVTEDEGQTQFLAVFTVNADTQREAIHKAGELVDGAFLITEYTFDHEYPTTIEKVGE